MKYKQNELKDKQPQEAFGRNRNGQGDGSHGNDQTNEQQHSDQTKLNSGAVKPTDTKPETSKQDRKFKPGV